MAKHRTVNEFYSSLLANRSVALDARWQRRIVTYANTNKKHHLLAGLLKRDDVTEDIVAELAGHRAAAVKSAWLGRHVDDISVIAAAIEGETRSAVLTSIVAEPNLPNELFDSIVADAEGVDLIVAALGTRRVSPDQAAQLLGRISSKRKLATDGVLAKLTELTDIYPELFDTAMLNTKDLGVLIAALPRVSDNVAGTAKVEAARRILDSLLVYGLEVQMSGQVAGLFRELAETVGATPEMTEFVKVYLARVREAVGVPAGNYDYHRQQLVDLETHLFDEYDQLTLTLDGTDERAVAALGQSRRITATRNANVAHAWQRGATPGMRRLCTRILCDTSYSDTVRTAAADQLVNTSNGVGPSLFKTLLNRRVPLNVEQAAKLHTKAQYRGLGELLAVVADPDALITVLVTEQLSAQLIIGLDQLGRLNDTVVVTAGEAVPARWFAELPVEHPAVIRVVEAGLNSTVDELGTNDAGWEFFEACYGTVAANPAVLAKLASSAS